MADYENVKRFWRTINLKKLSELNDIYSFQDTIILCKIFESRLIEMTRRFLYNLRKCTSASSLSGCIHWLLSKAITALPTQAEIVELFEKTLIGGFSCVNTRLAFDSSILLPKNQQNQPMENIKVIFKIKNKLKSIFEDKRVVTKILKTGKNDQYGNAMAKPLPTGSIKK